MLLGVRSFDLFDKVLLRFGFRLRYGNLFQPIRAGKLARVFDLFFFFGNRSFDHHTFTNHILDVLFLDFNCLVLCDLCQRDKLVGLGRFKVPVFSDTHGFDCLGSLFAFLSDDDLSVLVFVSDLNFFFRADAGLLAALSLLLADDFRFGSLAGTNLRDLASLLFLGLGLLPLEFQDRFASFDVLFCNHHFLLTADQIGLYLFLGRQIGDLLNSFGVQDVVLVEFFEGRLLKIVNGAVVQHISIQVRADNTLDFVTKVLAQFVECHEVKFLADRFQCFRELRIE